jgi:hypothetical protein
MLKTEWEHHNFIDVGIRNVFIFHWQFSTSLRGSSSSMVEGRNISGWEAAMVRVADLGSERIARVEDGERKKKAAAEVC